MGLDIKSLAEDASVAVMRVQQFFTVHSNHAWLAVFSSHGGLAQSAVGYARLYVTVQYIGFPEKLCNS